MIERPIPKDIKEYEPKFIGPLTLRNTVCIGLGALVSIPIGIMLSKVFVNEIAILVAGIICVPFIACGFKKIYGIPFEKFALMYIRTQLLVPKNRKYEVHNYYKTFLESENIKMDKKAMKKYQKRKKKDLRKMDSGFDVLK